MALIDDPRAWILLHFEREEREGRGRHCARFVNGKRPPEIPLSADEQVYGIYKNKYYFTPKSLFIKHTDRIEVLSWADIISCSSQHGDGSKFSTVTLRGCRKMDVEVGELATNWVGRISQLFHQMIERHGQRTAFGRPLINADEYFAIANDPYLFAPNLEPHPSLQEINSALAELVADDPGSKTLVNIIDDDGGPVSDEVVLVTSKNEVELRSFVSRFMAKVIQADEQTLRKVGDVPAGYNVWRIVWD